MTILRQKQYYLILLLLIFLGQKQTAEAQAPQISYNPSVYTFAAGSSIAPLSPTNTGGAASSTGQTTITYAGTGTAGAVNGSTATNSSFNIPMDAVFDASGNMYVADYNNNLIRKITPAGVVSTFAGSGAAGSANGTGTAASFNHPIGLTVDGTGNVYVSDMSNNLIRKITPAGLVSTFAGNGTAGATDNTAGLSASFNKPGGLAFDLSGNLLVADFNNNKIRIITLSGSVGTFAGTGAAGAINGPTASSTFTSPVGIAIDGAGNVYVTDLGQYIRKISSGIVSTLAGNGTAGYADGTGSAAIFHDPYGITVDGTGNIFVAEGLNNTVRQISPAGVVSTFAGSTSSGFINGTGTAARFNVPHGLTKDAQGNIYVTEVANNTVRKLIRQAFTISPALSSGLSFNAGNGVISGTPLTASSAVTYKVNAYNSLGISPDAQITISVNPAGALNFNPGQNYVVTAIPRDTDMSTDAAVAANMGNKDKVETTVQYLDGLGRPIQTVQVKGSPAGKDLVQPVAYDPFGREITKYLPYAMTSGASDGSYKTDALSSGQGVGQFYASPPSGVVATNNPYSQTVLEASPLNRVLEQGAPGADWQPGSSHTIKTIYTTNNALLLTDTANTMLVALYQTVINANRSQQLIRNGNYGAGQLSVTISKDENWKGGRGGTVESYKDKAGHVILKRSFNYIPAAAGPPAIAAQLQVLSTYYVYDELGNLAFVLPPGTNPDGVGVPQYAGSLGYQYRYDERNRLTQKKIPGKGWEFTVYNKLDQPVLTQDSLQRINSQWQVIKYDAQGRVIMTGIWGAPSVFSLGTLQSNIYGGAQWDVRDYAGNITANPTGYVMNTYPGLTRILTINYYDDYNNLTNLAGFPAAFNVSSYSTMTKGLHTATKTAVLNTITTANPEYLWTTHYYDDLGRSVKTFQQHYLGGTVNPNNYDEASSTYNFSDQVTTTSRKHFTSATVGTPKLTVNNKYLYDHVGRKIKTWEQLTNGAAVPDNNTWTLVSQTDYNEIGQLKTKHLHATYADSTHFRQDVAYAYNERGWLTSSSAPLFNEQLYYNTGTIPQYNGNISNQLWNASGGASKIYTYQYDQLNRLTLGNSTDGNNESGVTYDTMGNITKLNRFNPTAQIDALTYAYTAGTNTLQSVTDGTSNDQGQLQGITNYTYDGNGNLLSDNRKGITAISYNLLNLPQTITGKSTTYTYDATGQKLSRLIGTARTEYIDGIQYDGTASASTISFIQTEEGRVLPNGATYNYEYTLTDHLGNSRVSFDSSGPTATAKQVDDYYPFGKEISTSVASPKNEYLYNKKELQENLGLYDYGARFYDPVIARWTSVDPLAEISRRFSPYNYVENNPIRNIDPDGMGTLTAEGWTTSDPDEIAAVVNSIKNYQAQNGPGDKNKKKGDPKKKASSELFNPTKNAPKLKPLTGFWAYLGYYWSGRQFAGYEYDAKGNALSLAYNKMEINPPFGPGAAFNELKFAEEIIELNKATEGGGQLLSGTTRSIVNSAMYYEDDTEKGAAIFRSIISNHTFADGNKRTAVAAFKLFARIMGIEAASDTQLLNVANRVATGNLTEVSKIAQQIIKH